MKIEENLFITPPAKHKDISNFGIDKKAKVTLLVCTKNDCMVGELQNIKKTVMINGCQARRQGVLCGVCDTLLGLFQ